MVGDCQGLPDGDFNAEPIQMQKPQPRWTLRCVVCNQENENKNRREGENACNNCWKFFITNYENRNVLKCVAKALGRNSWGGVSKRRKSKCPGLDFCPSCLFDKCEENGLVFSHPIKDCTMCTDVLRGMVNTDDKRPKRCFTCGIYLSLKVGQQKSDRCSICRAVGDEDLLKDRTGLKCEVCENLIVDASQALHCGVVSCHPCAQFFIVGCFRGCPFRCQTGEKDCPVGKGDRGNCCLCLYNKCRSVGMRGIFDDEPVQNLRVETGLMVLSTADDQHETSAAVKTTTARRKPRTSAVTANIPIRMTPSATSGDSPSSSVSQKRHRSPEEDVASQSRSMYQPPKRIQYRIPPPPMQPLKRTPVIEGPHLETRSDIHSDQLEHNQIGIDLWDPLDAPSEADFMEYPMNFGNEVEATHQERQEIIAQNHVNAEQHEKVDDAVAATDDLGMDRAVEEEAFTSRNRKQSKSQLEASVTSAKDDADTIGEVQKQAATLRRSTCFAASQGVKQGQDVSDATTTPAQPPGNKKLTKTKGGSASDDLPTSAPTVSEDDISTPRGSRIRRDSASAHSTPTSIVRDDVGHVGGRAGRKQRQQVSRSDVRSITSYADYANLVEDRALLDDESDLVDGAKKPHVKRSGSTEKTNRGRPKRIFCKNISCRNAITILMTINDCEVFALLARLFDLCSNRTYLDDVADVLDTKVLHVTKFLRLTWANYNKMLTHQSDFSRDLKNNAGISIVLPIEKFISSVKHSDIDTCGKQLFPESWELTEDLEKHGSDLLLWLARVLGIADCKKCEHRFATNFDKIMAVRMMCYVNRIGEPFDHKKK